MQTESLLNHLENETLLKANIGYKKNNLTLAFKDITQGLIYWRIWLMLAYQDIRLKYRRSTLGPLWITFSMAITVYSLGFLYSQLFKIDLDMYFPYLVSGMLAWTLLSGSLIELTDTFISHHSLISGIKLPYSLHLFRTLLRNIIIFFHNMIVMIPIYFIFHQSAHINLNTLFIIPALFIFATFLLSLGLILALIAARYRDISQLIKNLIQVVFFITPVMWKADALSADKIMVVWCNPAYFFIQMIRAPLMGDSLSFNIIFTSSIISLTTFTCAFLLFSRYRSRIIYWL